MNTLIPSSGNNALRRSILVIIFPHFRIGKKDHIPSSSKSIGQWNLRTIICVVPHEVYEDNHKPKHIELYDFKTHTQSEPFRL